MSPLIEPLTWRACYEKKTNVTRARTTCQMKREEAQAYYHLSYDQSIKRKALSVKEKLERLDVCLHYQLIQQYLTWVWWQMALKMW